METSLTLLPRKSIKIKTASIELFKLNAEHKQYEEEYKKRKQELQDLIKSSGYEEFAFGSEYGNLKVKCVQSKKVIWDLDKLKSRLGNLFNQVVNKTYTINDYSGLVKYLKSCGVDPKKFVKYINVEKVVDNKKIDELSELGEITVEDLKGCYTLDIISEYVKVSELNEMDG